MPCRRAQPSSTASGTTPPGSEIVLIEFAGDPANPVFAKARDRIRAALARLTVIVQYTDIYDSHFTAYVKELSWFGR